MQCFENTRQEKVRLQAYALFDASPSVWGLPTSLNVLPTCLSIKQSYLRILVNYQYYLFICTITPAGGLTALPRSPPVWKILVFYWYPQKRLNTALIIIDFLLMDILF